MAGQEDVTQRGELKNVGVNALFGDVGDMGDMGDMGDVGDMGDGDGVWLGRVRIRRCLAPLLAVPPLAVAFPLCPLCPLCFSASPRPVSGPSHSSPPSIVESPFVGPLPYCRFANRECLWRLGLVVGRCVHWLVWRRSG